MQTERADTTFLDAVPVNICATCQVRMFNGTESGGSRPVSCHISLKQRDKGGIPRGRDQCLTWINVCLSALGRFLAWRSASSHSFLTWSDRDNEKEDGVNFCEPRKCPAEITANLLYLLVW